MARVHSAGESFYYVGDLFHHPCEVEHLDWVSPGRDRAAVRASRERLIAAAVALSESKFKASGGSIDGVLPLSDCRSNGADSFSIVAANTSLKRPANSPLFPSPR